MAAVMQKSNTLRVALSKGNGLSFGAWQMLPGAHLSRAIARSGVDWVLIDCEHGNIAGTNPFRQLVSITNISDHDMHDAVHAVASVGVSPIVRIAANEGWMVKRALDAGAHGVLVPLIYSVEDCKNLVSSAKFPPNGKRGFGSPFSPGAFDLQGNLSGLEYMQNANANLLTCVQIETKEALAVVEEIAKVDGIDVLFVGPWDLGNNIGHPVKGEFDPELKESITRIREAAKSAGKWSGIYCPSGEVARKYADEGFQMVSVMTDMVALPTFMAQSLATAKGGWAHGAAQAVKGAAYGVASLATQSKPDEK